MPRPITKADIKRWRNQFSFRAYTHERLGIFIHKVGGYSHGQTSWVYSVDANGDPFWVTKKTLEKRKKLGHPATKRKARQRMPEGNFSLEEMELASSIMEELSDGV